MSEDVQHSRPKGWKAFQVNYDYVFSQSDRTCCYALTQQQTAALLSMTEYLYWKTRWVSAADDVNQNFVTQFAENLERNLMGGCCGEDNIPIQYRYTPDGVLERSLNGGGTWMDAAIYDPRNYSPVFPPVPGDDGADKKCIAATGAAALLKEQVGDQLTDDMSRYTLGQLIKDWVGTMLESSNPFQALVTVITNQVFALVISVLRPALTDTVYDLFKCALYCHMADDASFDQAAWQAVRSDITSLIGGIAGLFLEHLVFLLGAGGLTNLARAGGATEGDCSSCCPDCSTSWIAIPDAGIGLLVGRGDGYVDIEAQFPGGEYYATAYTGDIDVCCKFDHYEVISGTMNDTNQLWKECGSNDASVGPLFGDHCIWTLQFASSMPFTIRMFFVPC